jgi:RNA polymerase sigma-70 factor
MDTEAKLKETIRKVLDGDKSAFREVVAEYGPGIRAFLATRINDSNTVEDLAQETFIGAYESLGQFDPDASFAAWLKGIARNKYRMQMRRAHYRRNALEEYRARALERTEAENIGVIEDVDSPLVEKLRRCLEDLPERLKEVINERYFERVRVKDIARRSGSSVSAVSSLLFRGRKQLETCIERTP